MTRKQRLALEIDKIVRIHCKFVGISSVFSKKLKFRSQHTNCVTYYVDIIINCDVTYLVLKDRLTNKEQF